MAGTASASLNFNIDVAYQTVGLPSSGSIQVMFTGTVDILLPDYDALVGIVENPDDGSNPALSVTFDPGFVTYLNGVNPGVDYSGNLFSLTVSDNTPLGAYILNAGGDSPLSEAYVTASNGNLNSIDNEFFGLTVVPEPATVAALALGGLALIRKRRK